MAQLCTWATVHWLRFAEARMADALDLRAAPQGAVAWKIGADGQAAPDGSRMPGDVWCAIGIYGGRDEAEAATEAPERFLPFLNDTTEYWQALLQPLGHKGECNLIDPAHPGPMFECVSGDWSGPMLVMTTAGFERGPAFDVRRVVTFRRNVDAMRKSVAAAGSMAHQVFAPHTPGDDGVTLSLWRDREHMTGFAYRPGPHRQRIDEHKNSAVMDRSSFTRFRVVRSNGVWAGRDPLKD